MKPWIIVSAVIVLLFAYGCAGEDPAVAGDQKDFNALVLEENRKMQYFSANHSGIAILKYAQADLDNDGKDDLIVIY